MYKEFAVYITGIYMLIAAAVAVVLYFMAHPLVFLALVLFACGIATHLDPYEY